MDETNKSFERCPVPFVFGEDVMRNLFCNPRGVSVRGGPELCIAFTGVLACGELAEELFAPHEACALGAKVLGKGAVFVKENFFGLLDPADTAGRPAFVSAVMAGDWQHVFEKHPYVRYAGHAPDHERNKAFVQRWSEP